MKRIHAMEILLILLFGVPLAGLVLLLVFFDANSFRGEISDRLGEQVGRPIKLEGPITLKVSLDHGFDLAVSDVRISNPPGASRPLLATIGTLRLNVKLMPLLQHRLDVTAFSLAGADVRLEKDAGGKPNWSLEKMGTKPVKPASAEAGQPSAPGKAAGGVRSWQVDRFEIQDSKIASLDTGKKLTSVSIQTLTLDSKREVSRLQFAALVQVPGRAAEVPFRADISGGSLQHLKDDVWPILGEVSLADKQIKFQGRLAWPKKEAVLDSVALKAGSSGLDGNNLTAKWGGARPALSGKLQAATLDPADFALPSEEAAAEGNEAGPGSDGAAKESPLLFSATPLELEALKAIDLALDLTIGEIPLKAVKLTQLQTKLALKDGLLILAPFNVQFAGSKVEGAIKLDASSRPARPNLALKAYQLDLGDVLRFGGLGALIVGKGDADLELATYGASLHEFASHATGRFSLIAAGGTLSEQALSKVAGGLLDVFSPGLGKLAKPDMNCLAARFLLSDGMMGTNGVLIDTAQATLLASGGINLRDETISMLVHSRAKAMEQVAAFAPPLRISGPLRHPSYRPDMAGSAGKLAGALLGTSLTMEESVPEMGTQDGLNACVYTLDHPQAAKAAPVLPANIENAVGKARDKIKDSGGKFLQDIGSKLFGK